MWVWILSLTDEFLAVSSFTDFFLCPLRSWTAFRGVMDTLSWPWHWPLKSVMLYQPHTDWKPQSKGDRSTEANPITLSISIEVKQWVNKCIKQINIIYIIKWNCFLYLLCARLWTPEIVVDQLVAALKVCKLENKSSAWYLKSVSVHYRYPPTAMSLSRNHDSGYSR